MASVRKRVHPNTRKVLGWVVDYRDAEGRKRTKGGFKTKADAEDWITDLRADRKQGTFVPHRVLSARFEDVAEEWLTSIKARQKLKPRTVEGYQQIFAKHVLPKFGRAKIGEITRAQIERWLGELERRMSPQTARNIHFALKACLNWAVRMDKLKVNPCVGVELPQAVTVTPRHALTEAEVHQVSSAMDEPTYALITRFAAYTGLRKGEILALRVMNLNRLHQLINVTEAMSGGQVSSPKTKAGLRTVPVPSTLWDELITYLGPRIDDPTSPIFADPNGYPSFVWRRFYRGNYLPAVKATLPTKRGVVFHSLRHTYTSMLEELEVRPKLMANVLGHSTGKVTFDVYTHIGTKQLRELADKLDARYRAAQLKQTDAPTQHLTAVPTPTRHACPTCGGTGWLMKAEAEVSRITSR